jgi:uncharacterized protein RhaS with RHS repeats
MYINQDPIRLNGGKNLYGYVHNPNTWVDKFGLEGCGETDAKTLNEWLKDDSELLEEVTNMYNENPEWWGIDPENTPVFYRPKDEVDAIRAKPGESGGHHPHGLALGGPEGQLLTPTNETRTEKNPQHSAVTGTQRRVITVIKKQS